MATDDRVKVLEGEFKLIKSELRQTLSSVRDFLLDIKLPPMQEEPGLTQGSAEAVTPDMAQQGEEGSSDESGSGENSGDGSGSGGEGFGPEGIPADQMPDFSGMDQFPDNTTSEEPSTETPAEEALPPPGF